MGSFSTADSRREWAVCLLAALTGQSCVSVLDNDVLQLALDVVQPCYVDRGDSERIMLSVSFIYTVKGTLTDTMSCSSPWI